MLFREIIAVYCENHTEHINSGILGVKKVVQVVTILLQTVKTDILQDLIKLIENTVLQYD
jgi:hypothetical protein